MAEELQDSASGRTEPRPRTPAQSVPKPGQHAMPNDGVFPSFNELLTPPVAAGLLADAGLPFPELPDLSEPTPTPDLADNPMANVEPAQGPSPPPASPVRSIPTNAQLLTPPVAAKIMGNKPPASLGPVGKQYEKHALDQGADPVEAHRRGRVVEDHIDSGRGPQKMPEWFGDGGTQDAKMGEMPVAMQETFGKDDNNQSILAVVRDIHEEARKYSSSLLYILRKLCRDLHTDNAEMDEIRRYFEQQRTTL